MIDVHDYMRRVEDMEKKDMKKKPMKMVIEKKTGEKYKSKAAMAKHEKSEPKAMRAKEYGAKATKKGKR